MSVVRFTTQACCASTSTTSAFRNTQRIHNYAIVNSYILSQQSHHGGYAQSYSLILQYRRRSTSTADEHPPRAILVCCPRHVTRHARTMHHPVGYVKVSVQGRVIIGAFWSSIRSGSVFGGAIRILSPSHSTLRTPHATLREELLAREVRDRGSKLMQMRSSEATV
ncbi:hypothetical protein HBI56_004000 [Parastagonospora nodorum]|nr:hypothetical protein HBI09_004340 [Parastagonospora nodorum]KAH4208078.1 hypothetical protein HBI95_099230 [Parastagonospora nodorum]KAH4421736.1 hypothetical protein HBH92_004810 [Parastagonospora nodorum]KAH4455394.1 hypothetical protein HBH93_004790 [Parastagonospora nodorum]KAH4468604.1 hypothetical protein HBH91_017760 [Parastagonospora nodorum]